MTTYGSTLLTVAVQVDTSPFGAVVVSEGIFAAENPFRFSTKYFDSETDLGNWGWRYYHPDIGRWLSRDPVEESAGANLFCCVDNNLVTGHDVFGLWGSDVHSTLTSIWAEDSGIQTLAADRIGQWDERVDSIVRGRSYLPGVGDQSYHFNTAEAGSEDTRLAHARKDFEAAKKACNWGEERDDPQDAAEALGRGLHARQDWYAHGDFSGWWVHNEGSRTGADDSGPIVPGVAGDVGGYPDVVSLDAKASKDGRPVGTRVRTLNVAEFEVGFNRIRKTEETTKMYLKAFVGHLKQPWNVCCKCREFFLDVK